MGLTEREKVRRYEKAHPGVDIPAEQKAERYERREVVEKYGGQRELLNARRRKASVGTLVVSKVWPGHPDYEEE